MKTEDDNYMKDFDITQPNFDLCLIPVMEEKRRKLLLKINPFDPLWDYNFAYKSIRDEPVGYVQIETTRRELANAKKNNILGNLKKVKELFQYAIELGIKVDDKIYIDKGEVNEIQIIDAKS